MRFQLPGGEVIERRRFLTLAEEQLSFELQYQFGNETLVSRSTIRFMPLADIQTHLALSGLQIEALYGSWDAQPFEEETSREMIFIVRAEN